MKNALFSRRSGVSTLITVIVVIAALRLAREILVPLALAILLSFLLFPLVVRLQRYLGRTAAVVIVTGSSFLFVAALGWLVFGQMADLVDKLPEYRVNIRSKIQSARTSISDRFGRASRTVDEIAQEMSAANPVPTVAGPVMPTPVASPPEAPPTSPFATVGAWTATLLAPLALAGVIVVFVIFFLIYYDDLRDRMLHLVGVDQLSESTQTLEDAAARVSRYLLMHTLLNVIHGVIVGLGVYCIGLPAATLWGLMSTLLRFIPYFGPLLASVFPVCLGLAIFDGWTQTFILVGFLILLELASNNLLEPWLYGSGTGLSPMAVIVAAVFWTWLWGTPGLALSAPLTVCLVVLGRHITQLRFLDILLNDRPVLDTRAQLYQRLLAMNLEAGAAVVERQLKDRPLVEVYDEVILPALTMAEQDRHRGDLEGDRAEFVIQSLKEIIEDCGESPVDQDAAKQYLSFPAGLERVSVVCLPARDTADELAAVMLVQLLKAQGVRARAASATSFTGELLETMAKEEVSILCISAVPPSAVPHVRLLYRRLRARFEKMPIIIGLWTAGTDPQRLRERFPQDEAIDCVTTLAAGCRMVCQRARAISASNAIARTDA